ncbi:hypothetical protein V5799_004143 [Amblyomma americanum]|uniref:THAP-type domain-containing protein n=1 Tax=Amblyomma americanum TaxID=6943 RepID=A0AAQ4D6Y2_AMBAM
MCKKASTNKGQQEVNVPSTSSLVAGTATQRGQQTAASAANKLSHIIADPHKSFREPVAKEEGSSYKCCVVGCPVAAGTGQEEVGVWLFALPSKEEEPSLHSAWLKGVRINLKANRPQSPRVCFRHFDSAKDFVTLRHRVRGLEVNAVPSIQIPMLKFVNKLNQNPFGRKSLQPQNTNNRLNTSFGQDANSAAGKNTPRQETRSTVVASPALGSVACGSLLAAAKFTRSVTSTVTEMTEESLRVAPQPVGAVGPSSSSMTETLHKLTAEHPEVSDRNTVTETAGEGLHAAPEPKDAGRPSMALISEAPKQTTVELADVSAQAVMETAAESLYTAPEPKDAGSTSAALMSEAPKQGRVESVEVSVQIVTETMQKSLHAAPEPKDAGRPSMTLMSEAPKQEAVWSTHISAQTVMETTAESLYAAPEPKDGGSTSVALMPDARKQTVESSDVGAQTVTETTTESLYTAQEPKDAVSTTMALMPDARKQETVESSDVGAQTVTETTTESLYTAQEPKDAVSTTMALMSDTRKQETVESADVGAQTVTETTAENLYTAPELKDAGSPSVALMSGNPKQGRVESVEVSAKTVTETTQKSLHAAPQPEGAGSPRVALMSETPKQASVESADDSAQTVTDTTGESLHAALQPVGAVNPSSDFTMEAPKKETVQPIKDSASTLAGATKDGISSTAQPKAISTGSSSTAHTLNEATSEPTEVNVCTAARETGGTLNIAQEFEDDVNLSKSVNLMADTPKEAPAEPTKDDALPPVTMESSDIAAQPKEATDCSRSSATETHKASDAPKLAADAYSMVQPPEKDLDKEPLAQDTGDTDAGSEMEDSPSSPIECITTFGYVSAESKNLEALSSSAEQPSSDSKSSIFDCMIVEMSPASTITLSSDEDECSLDAEPISNEGTVETRVSNVVTAQDSTPPPAPAHSFVCKLESASNDVSGDVQTAASSRNSAFSSVLCVDPDAQISTECSVTGTPVTVSFNSCDKRSSPSLGSGLVMKATRTGSGGHDLLLPKRQSGKIATVRVAEPPVTILTRVKDRKQKAPITLESQRHVSGVSSNTFGCLASAREGYNSAAGVVLKEETRCPPSGGCDVSSRAVIQKTVTIPSRVISYDGHRLQVTRGTVATRCKSAQRHSPEASVNADIHGTDSSWPEGDGQVTLFHPSQGRYIIEREVVGDEEEFGMHATSFRVDWIFTGSAPNMPRSTSSLHQPF